jgi:hypothetical protein
MGLTAPSPTYIPAGRQRLGQSQLQEDEDDELYRL